VNWGVGRLMSASAAFLVSAMVSEFEKYLQSFCTRDVDGKCLSSLIIEPFRHQKFEYENAPRFRFHPDFVRDLHPIGIGPLQSNINAAHRSYLKDVLINLVNMHDFFFNRENIYLKTIIYRNISFYYIYIEI